MWFWQKKQNKKKPQKTKALTVDEQNQDERQALMETHVRFLSCCRLLIIAHLIASPCSNTSSASSTFVNCALTCVWGWSPILEKFLQNACGKKRVRTEREEEEEDEED